MHLLKLKNKTGYTAGMEMTISILLGSIALLVLFLEFFLPGGIMAALGALLAMGSVVYAMAADMRLGMVVLIIETFVAFIVIRVALTTLKKRKFDLDNDQTGFISGDFDKSLIGKEAIVTKDLKPAGFIEIDGIEFQALSKGHYVRKDSKVIVIDGEGAHLIVR